MTKKVNEIAAPAILIVTGPAKGRWRIGRCFGRDPVEIPAADLSEAQLAALRDDPELSISVVGLAD